MKEQNLQDLLLVFVLDSEALLCAQKQSDITVRTDLLRDDLACEADFGTKCFRDIMTRKLQAIEIVLREGYHVIYFDSDVVLLQDPVKYYCKLPRKDIYFQSDRKDFSTSSESAFLCCGVMFIAAAPSSKMADVFAEAKERLEAVSFDNTLDYWPSDQDVLNDMMNNGDCSVGILDPAGYPNGARYFDNRSECWETPVLVHNNYIVGLQNKMDRFKKHGLWFIPATTPLIETKPRSTTSTRPERTSKYTP